MEFKIKDLTFDVQEFDLEVELSRVWMKRSLLSQIGQAIVKAVDKEKYTRVAEYDCTDGSSSFMNVTKDTKFKVEQNFIFNGLSKSGKITQAASEALRDKLSDAAGFSTILGVNADLNKRLGTYEKKVPYKKFLKAFGKKKSFYIDARVHWILWRLKPKTPLPPGEIYVVFPYAITFVGRETFDCKTGKKPFKFLEQEHSEPMVMLTPKDAGAKRAVGRILDIEIERAKMAVSGKERTIQDMESVFGSGEDPDLTKEHIENQKRHLKRLKEELRVLEKQNDFLPDDDE